MSRKGAERTLQGCLSLETRSPPSETDQSAFEAAASRLPDKLQSPFCLLLLSKSDSKPRDRHEKDCCNQFPIFERKPSRWFRIALTLRKRELPYHPALPHSTAQILPQDAGPQRHPSRFQSACISPTETSRSSAIVLQGHNHKAAQSTSSLACSPVTVPSRLYRQRTFDSSSTIS